MRSYLVVKYNNEDQRIYYHIVQGKNALEVQRQAMEQKGVLCADVWTVRELESPRSIFNTFLHGGE